MMELLRQQLIAGDDGVELISFFESCPSRHAMIVALLAVLELVRLQAILLVQQELFSQIRLRKHKLFDVVFSGGEALNQALGESLRGPLGVDKEYQ
jgi:chromatin segregation and condensation protein Rec8/ScpA/Scc1 (kleisin family)